MRFYPQAITAASINAALAGVSLAAGNYTGSSTGWIGWSNRAILRSPADATAALRNFAETLSVEQVVEANDVLALRRGTNAQALRGYNTFTDASNYERFRIGWVSNILKIGGEVAGTGTNRAMQLSPDGITTIEMEGNSLTGSNIPIAMYRNGTSAATILAVGSTSLASTGLLFTRLIPTINQASGTYVVLDINPTETAIGAGPHYLLQGRIGAGGNVFSVRNDGKLFLGSTAQFGGTSSSFPMWKQNGSQFLARKADDSAYTQITALGYQMPSSTVSALPAASSWSYTFMAVSDLNSNTRGATAAGGGSIKGIVWSDGTNWLVV